MTDLYAPNQQVVRPDGSGPAEEGSGGSTSVPPPPDPEPDPEPGNPLDAMTKDQLLAYAADRGIDVNASMTKAEIRAAIDAWLAETGATP